MFDMFFICCWAATFNNGLGRGSIPWFGHAVESRNAPETIFVGTGHFLSSCWSAVAYKHRAAW